MTIYQHSIGKDLILIAYSGNKYKNDEETHVKIPIGRMVTFKEAWDILDFAWFLLKEAIK